MLLIYGHTQCFFVVFADGCHTAYLAFKQCFFHQLVLITADFAAFWPGYSALQGEMIFGCWSCEIEMPTACYNIKINGQ